VEGNEWKGLGEERGFYLCGLETARVSSSPPSSRSPSQTMAMASSACCVAEDLLLFVKQGGKKPILAH